MSNFSRLINRSLFTRLAVCVCERGSGFNSSSSRAYSSHQHTTKTIVKPVIMKLDNEKFKGLFTPELSILANTFQKYNYEIRIAGGAVRDLLMGKAPKDLDFATVATPDQMREMFTKEGIRMINPKGESHGTITPRINDKENFEVTTLRIDVETDGRHAKVQFTEDWLLDANRRDLTINSMFLGLDGTVYDYFNGYDDLQKRRVVFVGKAEDRIREDYLRILRFFRFFGRIANDPMNYDEGTLEVIRANAGGLEKIAGERIWSEVRLILSGNHGPSIFKKMLSVGIAPHIGLPQSPNTTELEAVIERTDLKDIQLYPVSYLATVVNTMEEAVALNNRLKMSIFERELLFFIVEHRHDKSSNPLLLLQKLMLTTKFKVSDTREWCVEYLLYNGHKELAEKMRVWEMPRLPVTGNDLKNHVQQAKQMASVVKQLKEYWADHDYKPDAEELLSLIPKILEEIALTVHKPKSPKAKKKKQN